MAKRKPAASRPAPKLGQNFLVDGTAPRAIVEALGDLSQATVLEIGPGTGALTRLVAARARRVIAVEFDPALTAELEQTWPAGGSVEVVCQDILRFDISGWAGSNGVRLQVIGNLPYYISSPILMHLFEHSACIERAVLMLQREVAERIVAPPGSSDYGSLSAITQMYAQVEPLFTLPPESFSPPPKVFSSVFRLTMRSQFAQWGVEPATFIPFLRQAFALKRKTLANNLRAAGYEEENIQQAFAACGVAAQSRAEALPLEPMACLWRTLQG